MDLRSVINKARVIKGHAAHLVQAAGELPNILSAHPEIDIPEADAHEILGDLGEAAADSITAGEAIALAGEALAAPKKAKKS